jgi:hypothetical protein
VQPDRLAWLTKPALLRGADRAKIARTQEPSFFLAALLTMIRRRARPISQTELLVWTVAASRLRMGELAALKIESLKDAMPSRDKKKLSTGQISKTLKALVALGYLERGPNNGTAATYKVPLRVVFPRPRS